MAQSRNDVSPSRVELVVLACLSQSKPPGDTELGDAVRELAFPSEPAESARAQVLALLSELVRRAWVTPDDNASGGKPRTSASPRRLTDSGKRVLREAFHLSQPPTWAQVRDKHLPSLALGLSPGTERANKACTETALTAAVLCARFGVRDAANAAAVCDALVAKTLGMSAGPLTLDRIRAHVLAQQIDPQAMGAQSAEIKDGNAAKLAGWIARTTVGAHEPPRKKMARAVARRWVCGEASPLGECTANAAAPKSQAVPPREAQRGAANATSAAQAPSPPDGGAKSPTPPNPPVPPNRPTPPNPPPDLLTVVRETIPRIGTDGRFGEKVYVSSIWRTLERDRKAGAISLDEFKRWLLRANRDGALVLARADLIGAMDPKQVAESEINDRGATFHFVLDQRNGASAAQRESHAAR